MLTPHLIAAVLLVAFPFWDYKEAAWLRSAAMQARVRCYLRSIGVLWLAALAAIITAPAGALWAPPQQMGPLFPALSPDFLVAFLAALSAGLILPLLAAFFHSGTRKVLLAQLGDLDYLLPRTRTEILLFTGVSISAGVCEEVLYRGFLFHYLASASWHMAPLPALLLGSALFGLAHIGQGRRGVLTAGAAGLFLGGLYVFTGSLLVPMVVHTLIDLRATAMAWLRTLPQPGAA